MSNPAPHSIPRTRNFRASACAVSPKFIGNRNHSDLVIGNTFTFFVKYKFAVWMAQKNRTSAFIDARCYGRTHKYVAIGIDNAFVGIEIFCVSKFLNNQNAWIIDTAIAAKSLLGQSN